MGIVTSIDASDSFKRQVAGVEPELRAVVPGQRDPYPELQDVEYENFIEQLLHDAPGG